MTAPEQGGAQDTRVSEFAAFLRPKEGEDTFVISTSRQAVRASELWGFDFAELWPIDCLTGLGEGKITRWLQHRFPENPA